MIIIRYRKNGVWVIEEFDNSYTPEEITNTIGGREYELYEEQIVDFKEPITFGNYKFFLDNKDFLYLVNETDAIGGNLIAVANENQEELFEILSGLLVQSSDMRFYIQNSSVSTVNAYKKLFTDVFPEQFKTGPIVRTNNNPSFWVEQIEDVRNGIIYPEVLLFEFESIGRPDAASVICNKAETATWKGVMFDSVVTIEVSPQGIWKLITSFGEMETQGTYTNFTDSIWPVQNYEESEDTWSITPVN